MPDVTARGESPSPRRAVQLELASVVLAMVAAPWHVLSFLGQRSALRREIASDLQRPATVDEPPPYHTSSRPLRIFLSCAEPSGEIHAANFLRALRTFEPEVVVAGLGGATLEANGVAILGDPVQRATMGFRGVFASVPFYVGLLQRCAEYFHDSRPDVVVLVDSPALHVPLGRIARTYGVPVLHFVTPQHWAWAPWRAWSYARAVDRALTILPFEPAWFARRGVPVAHVGHPLLDELAGVSPVRADTSNTIAVLPGSRGGVIDLNLPWMLSAVAALRVTHPDVDVTVIQATDRHAARVERHLEEAGARGWARMEVGDLHRSLSKARTAFSVSGTALLDALHHRLPTVCIYRVPSRRGVLLYRHALLTPFFASVNLLAGREAMPEFCFRGDGPFDAVVAALARAHGDVAYRSEIMRSLDIAADRLGPPGACRRAALHVLDLARRAERIRPGVIS